ncbi:MAG TPA: X-Pro dipeptidyl-peptidase, partial [Alcanivorax sp.]|nr:X-Pro dipeptidyl-peptidase [Alcanivorax sp.]
DLFRAMWPGADLRDMKPNGGFGRPKFVPMYIARGDDEVLLGKPRIDLNLGGTSGGDSMPVFVGLGIQHANRRRVHVASEQLTPLPEKGIYKLELPAVSQPLKAGDRVGLVIYGFTTQFPLNSAFLARNASVKGDVWLPLTREEVLSLKPDRSFR